MMKMEVMMSKGEGYMRWIWMSIGDGVWMSIGYGYG